MNKRPTSGDLYLKLGQYYNERKQASNQVALEDIDQTIQFPEGQEAFFQDLMRTISINNKNQSDAILGAVAAVLAEYIPTIQDK